MKYNRQNKAKNMLTCPRHKQVWSGTADNCSSCYMLRTMNCPSLGCEEQNERHPIILEPNLLVEHLTLTEPLSITPDV